MIFKESLILRGKRLEKSLISKRKKLRIARRSLILTMTMIRS